MFHDALGPLLHLLDGQCPTVNDYVADISPPCTIATPLVSEDQPVVVAPIGKIVLDLHRLIDPAIDRPH